MGLHNNYSFSIAYYRTGVLSTQVSIISKNVKWYKLTLYKIDIQWGEQVFDTLPILQVFLPTKHVEVCSFLS